MQPSRRGNPALRIVLVIGLELVTEPVVEPGYSPELGTGYPH